MRIGRYHQQQPDWRVTSSPDELIGLEIETYNPAGRQTTAAGLDGFDPGHHPLPIAEEDGSLSMEHGLEVVTPPIPLQEAESEDGYFAKLISTLKDTGCESTPDEAYGLHINVNVASWSDVERMCVLYMLNRFQKFGEHVGKRQQAGAYTYSPRLRFQYSETRGGPRKAELVVPTVSKYCAAWIRPNITVMEVRLGLAVLDHSHVKDMLSYIKLLRDFTRESPNVTLASCFYDSILTTYSRTKAMEGEWGCALEQLFLRWLAKQKDNSVAKILYEYHGPHLKMPAKRLTASQEWLTHNIKGLKGDVIKLMIPYYMNVSVEEVHNGKNFDTTEQILRVGSLISQGTDLEAHPAGRQGIIHISEIRAAN